MAPTSGRSAQDGNFVREGFGLGLGVLRIKDWSRRSCSSTTPIDEENVHVRWVFTSPKSHGRRRRSKAAAEPSLPA